MHEDRSQEILNYITAMVREIGEFRAETKVRFEGLESRLGGMESRLDGLESQSGGLIAEVRGGFQQIREKLRPLHHKLDVGAAELLELKASNRDLRQRVETLERKVGVAD